MAGSNRVMSRRTFLRDLGHGAFALTVIGLAGCARGTAPTVDPPTPDPGSFDPLTYVGNLDEIESFWCTEGMPNTDPALGPDRDHANPPRWSRIGDANSSGYVLVRGGDATVVDTGQWCVPDVIEGGLMAVGLDWSAVGSVIVTHKHPDHWIGLPGALERAADAVVYAGAEDIPHIASPRSIVAVGAGDRVMDLAIIPTPGHTPGHIAVHDEAAGVLVVGDDIAWGPAIGFDLLPTSEDLPQTRASLNILAGLSFDTLLAGHGLPLIGGAREELAEYLAEA
jgi:glyoxylase-like metal-dependent hydrolase (beta-lactamase superfamily II)